MIRVSKKCAMSPGLVIIALDVGWDVSLLDVADRAKPDDRAEADRATWALLHAPGPVVDCDRTALLEVIEHHPGGLQTDRGRDDRIERDPDAELLILLGGWRRLRA